MQATGITKRIVRKSRMHLRPLFESFPCRSLAYRHVGIIRDKRFTIRGIRNADCESHPDEYMQKGYLNFGERKSSVIARDYIARRREWVFIVKHCIRGGNRDLRDCETVVHVPKIDHADYFSRRRPGRIYQHVVIICVARDDAAAQRRQCGNHLRLVEPKKPLDECAPLRISDVPQMVSNPRSAGEVPFQFAVCRRMRKIRQRGIHLAEKSAETAQQILAVRIYFREYRSRNIGQKPEKTLRSIRECCKREVLAARCWVHAWERKMGSALGQMLQRLALHLNEGLLPRGMHDFQDKFMSVG